MEVNQNLCRVSIQDFSWGGGGERGAGEEGGRGRKGGGGGRGKYRCMQKVQKRVGTR